VSEAIRTHLQQTLPDITPLVARTVSEANVFVYQYEFNAFLVDVSLADGEGLEFLVDVKTVLPEAPILIMAPADMNLEHAHQHLGQYEVLPKPIDLLHLEQKLAVLFPEAAKSASFHGSVRQMRLVDLIQVKCLSGDNCRLLITGPSGDNGIITISAGEILHAQTDKLAGTAAFDEILSWKRGFFHEADFPDHVEANINGRWEMVLMEAVRRSDECCALEVV
jgi:DNA-binding response OmpR family regulator